MDISQELLITHAKNAITLVLNVQLKIQIVALLVQVVFISHLLLLEHVLFVVSPAKLALQQQHNV